tara:strand:- start:1414 stop:2346 length:933 start_codon:yes stop_codon:yes gene_type:complete
MNKKFWNKIVFIIKGRKVKLPTVKTPSVKTPEMANINTPKIGKLKLPQFAGFDLKGKTSAIIFAAILGSTAVLSLAIYFSIEGVTQAPIFPEAGVYDVAGTQQLGFVELTVGEEVKDQTQTLQVNIGGSIISDLVFKDMNVGADSGVSFAVQVDGTDGSGAKILCENLTLKNIIAPSLRFNSSTAYALFVSSTISDGFSITPTLNSDPVDYVFGSDRGALSVPEASGSDVDRIVVSTGSSTSTVGNITFENIRSKNPIDIQDISCGTVIIKDLVIGDGTGIDSASFVLSSTVKTRSLSSVGNTERNISVK